MTIRRLRSRNRHGITFSIATGEPSWTDLSKVVKYGVSDVVVTDGQGQNVPFTSKVESNSWTERSSLDLRIGDPERTLDDTEATYRVRWHGTGMLRTVNGLPNLNWTVTSSHMPPIDAAA